MNKLKKIIILFLCCSFFYSCTTTNYTKTEEKILDYERSGSVLNAISLGEPSAALLFLAVDINNYLKI